MSKKKTDTPVAGPPHWKRNLWLFLISQFVSGLSSSAVQYALIWYLTFSTGSATIISLAALVGLIPTILLSPFVGPFIDRFNRKLMLILPDIIVASFALLLFAFGMINGELTITVIFIALFVRAIAGTFQFPTVQAVLPSLVPRDEITKANGKASVIQAANTIVSPALGAGLMVLFPIEGLVLFDVVGATIAILILIFVVKIPLLKKKLSGKIKIFKETATGFRTLVKNRGMFYLSLINSAIMVFFMPAVSLYPLMITGYFGGDVVQVGAIEVIWSLGMMLGGGLIGARGAGKNRMNVVFVACAVMGVAFGASGFLPASYFGFIIFSMLNFVAGVGISFSNAPFMAMLQESFPAEKLGRVFGVMNSLMGLAGPFGLLFAGPLADWLGVEKMFIIAGAGVLVCLAVAWSIPSIRHYDINLRRTQREKD